MQSYRKSLALLIFLLLIFEGIVFYFSINRPPWGDELHFIDTVKHFGKDMSITTIKHYNELNAPLPFILYAIWGRIFNFDIQTLRLFSIIIAIITYLLLHRLSYSLFGNNNIALLTTAFIALNPYMIGVSVFVFTDMLPILFMIIACFSIRNLNPTILSVSLSCCLLSRQFYIFFVLAVGLYYFIKYIKSESPDTTNIFFMLLSCMISIIPLVILVFFLWKGLSPINELRNTLLDEVYGFHPSFLTLYISQLSIYLAPLVVIFWKLFYKNNKIIIGCFIMSWFYWLYPVRASTLAIVQNVYTVGLFHKFISFIFRNRFIEDAIFYLAFLLGLPIIVVIIKDLLYRVQTNIIDFALLLNLSIMSFLLIMPFYNNCWEKYFLPLLPLAMLRILLMQYDDNNKTAIR